MNKLGVVAVEEVGVLRRREAGRSLPTRRLAAAGDC